MRGWLRERAACASEVGVTFGKSRMWESHMIGSVKAKLNGLADRARPLLGQRHHMSQSRIGAPRMQLFDQ